MLRAHSRASIARRVVSVVCTGLVAAAIGCTKATDEPAPAPKEPASSDTVELKDSQVGALKLAALTTRPFQVQRTAVGSIDFNENDAVQVFSPYPGRIIKALADIGDDVRRGATLYTIDSPDLLQAESTLITDAGQADVAAAALARAQDLYAHEGMAQKDYEQAVADQMSAQAALEAARDAVRIFGKSDAAIDTMVAKRKVDATLVIPSPVTGRVTARFAQPGLLVQPGNPPAPYAVADLSTMWMLANVTENDVSQLHVGQDVKARIAALDDEEFAGRIQAIGASIDPTTHTLLVRSELRDSGHKLRPGMLATFVIQVAAPVTSVAIPLSGVVREGDGTMTVWVSGDRRKFMRRTVTIGQQQDGFDQILSGVQPGELAVIDGAILLSNILFGGSGDQ